MSHCSLGWYWRADLGNELVSFVSGDVISFSGVLSNLLCCLFSVCVECYSSFGSPTLLSPTSSLKYLIYANSPIFIMSHSVHTTLEYGAGTAKRVQWLATGWTVWDSNPARGKSYYLAQICPSHGLGRLSHLFKRYERPGGCSTWGVYLLTHLHLASWWIMSETILPVRHMSSWLGQDKFTLLHFMFDVHLHANVLWCRHCTHFVFLQCKLQMSWKCCDNGDDDDDDDDDNDEQQEEERISENSYFWISLQNTPHVTVQSGVAFEGGKWGDRPRPRSWGAPRFRPMSFSSYILR